MTYHQWVKKIVILQGEFVYIYQNGMEFLQTCENIAQVNPLIPKSDKVLISLYNLSLESNV